MKKIIFSLSMAFAIAGVNGCSSSENEKGNTEIEGSTKVENEIRGSMDSQDTIQVEHEVKTLSDEVDSLLKDI